MLKKKRTMTSIQEERPPIKIMVASTVYRFQDTLKQICAILNSYGYEVINSYYGTLFAHPSESNLQNCINAVTECDIFLGIIRTSYGTGVLETNGYSITHQEIKTAIQQNKPRWFLAHRDVPMFRVMFKKLKIEETSGNTIALEDHKGLKIEKNDYFDNKKVIEIYNDAIRSDIKDPRDRTNNWVQEYFDEESAIRFIRTQFSNVERIRKYVLKQV
jgi:hypothetical protein